MNAITGNMRDVISELENALDWLNSETCKEIFHKLDSYSNVSKNDPEASIGRNLSLAVASLKAMRAPEPGDLKEAVITTVERFHSGVSIEQVILAFRMSFRRIHEMFIDISLGKLEAEELVKGSQILSGVSDAFTARAVTTFHQLVVDSAVADASRRAAALRTLLAGNFNLSDNSFPLQVNNKEKYAVVRALIPAGKNIEQVRRIIENSGGRAGAPATVVVEDGTDGIGIVTKVPNAPEGVLVGIGPFVELAELPVSDRMAMQALALSAEMGKVGVQGLSELNWRLAATQASSVDKLFRQKFVEPLGVLGDFGSEVLSTIHAWLKAGRSISRTAQAQTIHENTVRYRLSKFADLTRFDPDNLDDLVGLIWVLEMPGPTRTSSEL